MADPATISADGTQLLAALMVGGLMGLLGQGARTVVGMKNMIADANSQGLDQDDVFRAARLLFSLLIGFLVGIAAAIMIGPDKLVTPPIALQTLLGIAAAGYAGTDFIEGFISKFLPGATADKVANRAKLTSLVAPAKKLTPQQAQDVVFGVLKGNFPNAQLAATQPLSQYGYSDGVTLIGLRDQIYNACGVYINASDIIKCQKISDVIGLLT
jgi:hypothetical protein